MNWGEGRIYILNKYSDMYIHRGKMTYYINNRDYCLAYQKQWREKHKEYIEEYKAKYNADPANQEKMKTFKKEYYRINKEYLNEKIECECCGSIISRNSISRHKKSNKCKNHIK